MDPQLELAPPVMGWPDWMWTTPYVGEQHPLASDLAPLAHGANCQRYAYAVLALYRRTVPALRSSELWVHDGLQHVSASDVQPLDLVLVNRTADPFGAHVGVHVGADAVLHLCAEAGRPTVWTYAELAARDRYHVLLGWLRVPTTANGVTT